MKANTLSVWDFLNRTDISTGEFIMVALGGLIAVLLLFFSLRACVRYSKLTGIQAHSVIKILLFASGPLFVSVLAIFHIEIPYVIPIILTVITGLVVVVWNILSFGAGYGILFSVLHLAAGFFVGLGIGGIILMGVFIVALLLIRPFDLPGGSGAGTASSYVHDVQTNESFYVTEMKGVQQIQRNGDWVVIRPGVYAGRYIDDYGNEYADSYD